MIAFFQPRAFASGAKRLLPWTLGLMGIFLLTGYAWVFGWAPPDAQQGNLVAILYLHVPCAWFACVFYGLMALFSGVYLVWRLPLAAILARALALPGILFTAVCLITGSLWGINAWGTWWVWDARLTSVLILFFLYGGFFLMTRAHPNPARASLLAIIGAVNLPIIKWSVTWWNTLHQPASVLKMGGPAMTHDFLVPLLICGVGWLFYGLSLTLMRVLSQLKEKKHVYSVLDRPQLRRRRPSVGRRLYPGLEK